MVIEESRVFGGDDGEEICDFERKKRHIPIHEVAVQEVPNNEEDEATRIVFN
jgi:hypothetical protein